MIPVFVVLGIVPEAQAALRGRQEIVKCVVGLLDDENDYA